MEWLAAIKIDSLEGNLSWRSDVKKLQHVFTISHRREWRKKKKFQVNEMPERLTADWIKPKLSFDRSHSSPAALSFSVWSERKRKLFSKHECIYKAHSSSYINFMLLRHMMMRCGAWLKQAAHKLSVFFSLGNKKERVRVVNRAEQQQLLREGEEKNL